MTTARCQGLASRLDGSSVVLSSKSSRCCRQRPLRRPGIRRPKVQISRPANFLLHVLHKLTTLGLFGPIKKNAKSTKSQKHTVFLHPGTLSPFFIFALKLSETFKIMKEKCLRTEPVRLCLLPASRLLGERLDCIRLVCSWCQA